MLISAAIGAIFWAQAFYESIKNYQSPLVDTELLPQVSPLPKMGNVVVVLVGGLGYDALESLNLPAFQQLAQVGANAVIQSSAPSYSQIAQITLVTGASPETNGAPLFDKSLEDLSPIEIDTIFTRARQSQHKTAILGPAHWRRLIPGNYLDETFFVDTSGPEADQAIVEAALPILKDNNTGLVFIHLTQLDFAAKHQGGPSGNAYRLAAGNIDAYLSQISRATDTNRGALIILGDHGYTASGGYGGTELEIVRQPLVIVGQNIIPGSYSDVSHIDIAPTISALLGAVPPTATQGRILFEMLRLNEQNQTIAQLTLTQQRIALAQAYLTKIKNPTTSLPDTLSTDLARAQTAFAQNNISGAFQLARLTQEAADSQMIITRYNRIRSEQVSRLLVVGAILSIWFIVMWRQRGPYLGLIIVAAIATIGLYHTLYRIQGYSYSISDLNNFAELPFDIARRTAVSMLAGGGLILILLMLVNEENWVTLLAAGYGFGVLVTFVFALPLFWAFWQNGFIITWYLPAVNPVFWQITAFFEVMIAAILGFLLPWPIMFLNLLVNLVRHRLDETTPRPEPDALPGLHL